MVKKRTFSSAKIQDDIETNVAITEDSEAYETVNTEDDTDNEEITLRPTTSKATAEAKYSDDNEEITLRPTTSKATAEAKYYDDNDEMTMTLRPKCIFHYPIQSLMITLWSFLNNFRHTICLYIWSSIPRSCWSPRRGSSSVRKFMSFSFLVLGSWSFHHYHHNIWPLL
jgi:hypothetical protein